MGRKRSYSKSSYDDRQMKKLIWTAIFIGKILWFLFKWTAFIVFSISVWLWEQWTYYIDHGEKRMGWLVRALIPCLFIVITFCGFFVYNNRQVIASEGLRTAMCLRYPRACFGREIRQEIRKDILQASNSGTEKPVWKIVDNVLNQMSNPQK